TAAPARLTAARRWARDTCCASRSGKRYSPTAEVAATAPRPSACVVRGRGDVGSCRGFSVVGQRWARGRRLLPWHLGCRPGARGRGDVGSCRGTSAVGLRGAGTPLPGCSMRARLARAGVTWQTSRCSDGAAAPTLGLGRAELPGATERAPAGGTPSDRREGAG